MESEWGDEPNTCSVASAVPPTPTQAANTPASDTGTVAGRILWGGQGMAGATVKLCTPWGIGAWLPNYRNQAITDKDGHFTFSGFAGR